MLLSPQLDHQKEKEEANGDVPQPLSDKDGDEERKRELAEEGMAQAGQPQTLEEDLDQLQEEEEEEEPVAEQPDENALEREREQVGNVFLIGVLTKNCVQTFLSDLPFKKQGPHADQHPEVDLQQQRQREARAPIKSPYQEQQEQQRLEAQRAKERQLILFRQQALQAAKERVQQERERKLREQQQREEQLHRETDAREQRLREEQQQRWVKITGTAAH